MSWDVLVELTLSHDYYAPNMPPVAARAANPDAFERAELLLRQSGARVFVIAEDHNIDLPATVALDLDAQNRDVVTVTEGADWRFVPHVRFQPKKTKASQEDMALSEEPQKPGQLRLAQVTVPLVAGKKQNLEVQFSAMSSHWAYHIIGPGNDDVTIEDTEGEVQFDTLGLVDLPDGRPAQVIRSRNALPARARPNQRFSLSRPGPFGPRTLIPVLPAPQPLFARMPAPKGASAVMQSDIYVSIF